MYAFEEFPKIPRLKREVVITEKIDGTNAQIAWVEILPADTAAEYAAESAKAAADAYRADPLCLGIFPALSVGGSALALYAGSRTRWLGTSSGADNFGFAKWVLAHAEELRALGPGRHYGEWYGVGIQRGYGLLEKRFALFNAGRWTAETKPTCCDVVPILARGEVIDPDFVLDQLTKNGSAIAPGFMKPEGVIVYHSASRQMYKLTVKDDGGKWRAS